MKIHRIASPVSIVLALALSIAACSSGSGGPPTTADGSAPPSGDGGFQLVITSPDADEIDTTDDAMDVAGSASSQSGISSVSWSTDHGESGTASGTDAWSIDQIPLVVGVNTVTVTATDSAGETVSDSIVINRESEGTGATTLTWDAPTERTDGTALTNLAGYRIHYGRMSGIYDYQIDLNTPGIMTYVIEDLVPGEWFFTVTAYDSEGLESDFSNEARRIVP